LRQDGHLIREGEINLAYNVGVSYPVLWPDDGPFYGPFDRPRWPRTEIAAALEEYSSRFEITSRNDERPMLEMQWMMVVGADGGFRLRAEWKHLRQENFDT
jgi:hypothetical protein